MIEQFDHESSVQKVRQLDTIKLILKKDVIEQLMSETPKTPKSTSQRKTASQHHHSSEDNKKEHEMMEQLSMNRIKQVDNVRQAALIETKMRLAEREKDLAEINATMLDVMEAQRVEDEGKRADPDEDVTPEQQHDLS